MLIKSNSVPNFLFESPRKKEYKSKIFNLSRIISYSEFLRNNPKATKIERQSAIKNFYDSLLRK